MKKSEKHYSAIRTALLILTVIAALLILAACTGDTECKHEWKDATCTAPKTCTLCAATEGEPLAEHSFGEWETVTEATCTAKGEKRRTCACGEFETEEIKKLMHDTVTHDKKEPTCTEDGHEMYLTCKNCDFTTYRKISARHKYEAVESAPTCTKNGSITYTCSVCGDSYVVTEDEDHNPILPAHGHGFGAWFPDEPVTATEDGTERRNCMNCNDFETRPTAVKASGSFGTSATYTLFNDGTLRIAGSGKTMNCGAKGVDQPFYAYRSQIKHIIVCDGITEIGAYGFAYLTSLEDFSFASSVKTLREGTFSASFKQGITRITFPVSIETVEKKLLGRAENTGAFITDVIFEYDFLTYPTNFNDASTMFNSGENLSAVTVYSYGKYSSASTLANTLNITYLNLNDMVIGTVGNIDYTYFAGALTLTVKNPSSEAPLPDTAPWLGGDKNVTKTDITKIVIGEGVKSIPANYFEGYTSLTAVELPSTVKSIGSGAFKTDAECATKLVTNFPKSVSFIGDKVFENRTNVTVHAFWYSAADNFSEDGVTLKVERSFNILLIGNSLSQDAGDSNKTSSSQLYEVLKAMLGEDSSVNVGILTSGARTAGWHATVAESGKAAYSFYVIGDSTEGQWSNKSGVTSVEGLTRMAWDIITIQPYATEATTGVGSMQHDTDGSDGNPKDEKFCPLAVSLPYLLDHIDKYAPGAKVYYYMTWATTTSTHETDIGLSNLVNRINIAKQSMSYKGTTSGKEFSGIINAGTAIQNARRTYLAYLNRAGEDDPIAGIQRDGVHIAYYFGRYILALTFAEVLIPEDKRADGYVLPDIPASCASEIGKVPAEYTEIAQLAVRKTIESISAEGDAQYMPSEMTGYDVDPATTAAALVPSIDFTGICATDEADLCNAIVQLIEIAANKDGLKVSVISTSEPYITSNETDFTATVQVRFGYTAINVDISGTVVYP